MHIHVNTIFWTHPDGTRCGAKVVDLGDGKVYTAWGPAHLKMDVEFELAGVRHSTGKDGEPTINFDAAKMPPVGDLDSAVRQFKRIKCPGIGRVRARLIAEKLGPAECFGIIKKDPAAAAAATGLDVSFMNAAVERIQAYESIYGDLSEWQPMHKLLLHPSLKLMHHKEKIAMAATEAWGANAVEFASANPFRLARFDMSSRWCLELWSGLGLPVWKLRPQAEHLLVEMAKSNSPWIAFSELARVIAAAFSGGEQVDRVLRLLVRSRRVRSFVKDDVAYFALEDRAKNQSLIAFHAWRLQNVN